MAPTEANADEVQFAESVDGPGVDSTSVHVWGDYCNDPPADVTVLVRTKALDRETLELAREHDLTFRDTVNPDRQFEKDRNPLFSFVHENRE